MITEVTPYICVDDARRAVEWYREVFDAGLADGPLETPDGRIGHVEMYFGDSRIFLSEEFGKVGVAPPDGQRGASVTIHLTTDRVDDFAARAEQAGASIDRHPQDMPYGRIAVFRDPFGHRWMLHNE